MTHEQWQDLIPYYVNRTLSDADRSALERHLTGCAPCREALEEWHWVAGVVRREADTWARQTPSFSPETRAQIQTGPTPSSNGHSQVRSALKPEATISMRAARRAHAPARRPQLPLTMAAAAAVIITFGVLLLYLASRGGDESPQSLSAVDLDTLTPPGTPIALKLSPSPSPSLANSATPFATPAPLITPSLYSPPPDLGILPPGGGMGGGDGSQSNSTPVAIAAADPNVCAVTSATGIPVPIRRDPDMNAPEEGRLYPETWLEVFRKSPDGWYQVIWLTGIIAGWVMGSAVETRGPCADIPDLVPTQVSPSPTPMPTLAYGQSIGTGYVMITTDQVGAIPPNTLVRISHATYNDGIGWLYVVVMEDERTIGEAYEWQLTYAPGVTPGPTPTAEFDGGLWAGYGLVTTTQVGNIPAGARVRIGGAWFDGYGWRYTIVMEDEQTVAEARASQLAYAPGFPLTPTQVWPVTPTAVWRETIGTGYDMLTTEQVGSIPANTRVRIVYAWHDGTDWVYAIQSEDFRTADARTWQITRSMGPTPIGATPTDVFQYFQDSDYHLKTREQVGSIPANTWVRIYGAWYDGAMWRYQIVTRESVLAEAAQYQLIYPPLENPDPTPTPTPLIPPGEVTIRSFTASPDPVARGGTITLAWNVSGATTVKLTRLSERGGIFIEPVAPTDSLTAAGSIQHHLPPTYINTVSFILIATDSQGHQVTQAVTAAIICPYSSSLTDDCPITQTTVQAAYQPFENGLMVWFADTNDIYALYNDNTFDRYPDTWADGETFDIGDTPPAGRTQPVRGFGKVWATQPGVRSKLGWALNAEQGYTTTRETHQLWLGRNQTEGVHFRLPDGRIVHQTANGWTPG